MAVILPFGSKPKVDYLVRKRKKRVGGPQFAAIRIGELNKLLGARYGRKLPPTELARTAAFIACAHLIALRNGETRIGEWLDDWAPWITRGESADIVFAVKRRHYHYTADGIAKRLNVNYAERQALRLTTIGATDCKRAQREAIRRAKSKARSQARRNAKR